MDRIRFIWIEAGDLVLDAVKRKTKSFQLHLEDVPIEFMIERIDPRRTFSTWISKLVDFTPYHRVQCHGKRRGVMHQL
jgi:hypothetical protein